jgi:hypothetical protein
MEDLQKKVLELETSFNSFKESTSETLRTELETLNKRFDDLELEKKKINEKISSENKQVDIQNFYCA